MRRVHIAPHVLDRASFVTLLLTLVLFGIALFEKGFSHDLLLEAGVFLVSVKLVLAFHRLDLHAESIERKLDLLSERRRLSSKWRRGQTRRYSATK
jgi:hypothetical protein